MPPSTDFAAQLYESRNEDINALEEQYLHDIYEALPEGTLVDIRKGRSDTKTEGWIGPYEVTGHRGNGDVLLRNTRTAKSTRWWPTSDGMRLSILGDGA